MGVFATLLFNKYINLLLLFALIIYLIYALSPKTPQFVLFLEDSNTEDDLQNFPTWKPSELEEKANESKSRLFNLKLNYIVSPKPCPNDILAVIIVTSHPNNVETRSSMRRSLSYTDLVKLKLRRFFLLGEAPDNQFVRQASVVHESKRFGDIIQGNFREAYRNLTYKHVMGLKWASENCGNAKYLIKMDDDIVFYTSKVMNLLNNITLPSNSMAGYVLRNMKAIREPANKWFVTEQEYRFKNYPAFISGWFYVTTPQVASKLVTLSRFFKYFWIDDVFLTGMLAKNLRIKLIDFRKYFTLYAAFLQCCMNDVMKKKLTCDVLIGPNDGENDLFYKFNRVMEKCESHFCGKRSKPIDDTCVTEKRVLLKNGDSFIENYKLH